MDKTPFGIACACGGVVVGFLGAAGFLALGWYWAPGVALVAAVALAYFSA